MRSVSRPAAAASATCSNGRSTNSENERSATAAPPSWVCRYAGDATGPSSYSTTSSSVRNGKPESVVSHESARTAKLNDEPRTMPERTFAATRCASGSDGSSCMEYDRPRSSVARTSVPDSVVASSVSRLWFHAPSTLRSERDSVPSNADGSTCSTNPPRFWDSVSNTAA